ncbi:MAG: uroporphyrinogen-III synthase [Chloroflexi bacterium]|nr:uroporphyrinogen-III synthase [Chloroflexota bacterium]
MATRQPTGGAADPAAPPVVVNTRPTAEASALSRLLREAGFEPLERPTVTIAPSWSDAELAAIASGLRAGAYDWIVVSSRNAAGFLVEALEAIGSGREALQPARILSGTGTAQTLAELGVPVDCALPRYSAQAALDALSAWPSLGRVLAPRAAEGRDELVRGLAERGVLVDAPVLYATRPADPTSLAELIDRLRGGNIAAVTFCSPSAVHGLIDAIGPAERGMLEGVSLVTLGGTTSDAVRACALRVAATAERTSLEALVDAVRSALPASASLIGSRA